MNEKPKIYLESSFFSALEGREEDKWKICRDVLGDGENGRVEIVVSALLMVECEPVAEEGGADLVAELFESEWITRCNVDPFVAEDARRLQATLGGAIPPHAWLHLATARLEACDWLFSFDKRLLKLNGQIESLQIAAPCRPWDAGQMSLEDIAGVMPEMNGFKRRSLVL